MCIVCVSAPTYYSQTVMMMVGIWPDNSLSVTETYSELRHPSQQPPGSSTEREKKKKAGRGVGWTQEVITICIEIGLTSASTPSPRCPKPDWTQQMLVEVESRDGGGVR